jgi:anti-sigma B factor antagonist
MKFQVHLSSSKSTYLIKLIGDLDASSAIQLDNALIEAIADRPQGIMVDCTDLNYISSAGIGVFLSHVDALRSYSLPLVLYGMSPKILNIFQMLSLEDYMLIVENDLLANALVNRLIIEFPIVS